MSPDQPDDGRAGSGDPLADAADRFRAEADAADDAERIADDRLKPTRLWVLLSGWLLGLEAWLRSHGGKRLQYGIRAFWTIVAVAGLVLLLGPVINKPMTLEDITSSASTATGNWIARDFAADYTIARAGDGTLRAEVVERITAFFPDDVDESGIQRVLPVEYQGHALEPSIAGATIDGVPVEPRRETTTERLVLTLDAGERLVGDHDIVLRYELSNLAYEATDDATGAPVELLEWDVFGPSWPQGFASLDVSVTLPEDVDERLIRQPRGSLAWTLLGAGAWLEPEPDSPPGQVAYRFTNEQNIPPHAQAWFTMSFEPGTFAMPERTPWFWVQTFGPLAPLAFLAVTLLLALAARAVAWSDARGRPWFVAQYEPPRAVTPGMAAQILRTPRTRELAEALAPQGRRHGSPARGRALTAARVAMRTGRIGDLPRAMTGYLTAPERHAQVTEGYRRIPRGFVRDLFLAAPIALTLVQWGLVRQLSYQAKLAVVWWPVAFVLASTVIAAAVVAIALAARPLTRKGALLRQHLLGIGVYAGRTELLSRAEPGNRLLPYAVLLAPAREAGRSVVALLEQELGDGEARQGWRTGDFLTRPRLLVRALAALVVAGTITMIVLVPNPYASSPDYATRFGDVPGSLYAEYESFSATAELSRSEDGRARLEVTERLAVTFEEDAPRVPQFARQWPNTIDGQELGTKVERVLLDGEPVPFATEQDADTLLMRTTMGDVRSGRAEARIDYVVESAAYASDADGGTGGLVDRVRWVALLEGWEYFSQWSDEPVEPVRVEFVLSDELAELASTAGWITQDTRSADSARDWEETVIPFGTLEELLAPAGEDEPDPEHVTTEESAVAGGARSHAAELRQDEYGMYAFELRVSDTGVAVEFPAGTFAGPDPGALRWQRTLSALPMVVALMLGIGALLLGIGGLVARRARQAAVAEPGAARDLLLWLAPASALAALIVFVWASIDMPSDHSGFAPLAAAAIAAITGGVAALVAARRRRVTR